MDRKACFVGIQTYPPTASLQVSKSKTLIQIQLKNTTMFKQSQFHEIDNLRPKFTQNWLGKCPENYVIALPNL